MMLHSPLKIRTVSPKDVELLQLLCTETFKQTYASSISFNDLQVYVKHAFDAKQLLIELQNPNSFYYFAEINNQPVAFMKLNLEKAQTQFQIPRTLQIQRIYVLENYKNNGAGKALLQIAIHQAVAFKCQYLWLAVWEQNKTAINFYTKQGFYTFDETLFEINNIYYKDFAMKKEIHS